MPQCSLVVTFSSPKSILLWCPSPCTWGSMLCRSGSASCMASTSVRCTLWVRGGTSPCHSHLHQRVLTSLRFLIAFVLLFPPPWPYSHSAWLSPAPPAWWGLPRRSPLFSAKRGPLQLLVWGPSLVFSWGPHWGWCLVVLEEEKTSFLFKKYF